MTRTLNIQTMGCFGISVDGKAVATEWPDETAKLLFCSLLSPLDLSFAWDRVCRSILGVPATRSSRLRLEEDVIRPLNGFLIKELGLNPIICQYESISIDHQHLRVDALEFRNGFVEGLRLLSLGNYSAHWINSAGPMHSTSAATCPECRERSLPTPERTLRRCTGQTAITGDTRLKRCSGCSVVLNVA